MIIYMFQCHSPKPSHLALSHRVQKTVLYICVSLAVEYGLSGLQASVVVAHGLSSCDSQALEHRLFCGAQASLLHGMWDLPSEKCESWTVKKAEH